MGFQLAHTDPKIVLQFMPWVILSASFLINLSVIICSFIVLLSEVLNPSLNTLPRYSGSLDLQWCKELKINWLNSWDTGLLTSETGNEQPQSHTFNKVCKTTKFKQFWSSYFYTIDFIGLDRNVHILHWCLNLLEMSFELSGLVSWK